MSPPHPPPASSFPSWKPGRSRGRQVPRVPAARSPGLRGARLCYLGRPRRGAPLEAVVEGQVVADGVTVRLAALVEGEVAGHVLVDLAERQLAPRRASGWPWR